MRASFLALLALCSLCLPVAAQWPGEVTGRVVDAVSGEAVASARVSLPASDRHTLTDASGHFLIRGVEPGEQGARVEHLGYVAAELTVRVVNGRTRALLVPLEPAPLSVAGFRVTVLSGGARGHRLRVDGSASAGALGVGGLLATLPGVTVTRRGAGARETVSIRGSAPDAVLVLVDGTPLNDPLTGEADLSTLSAASIREIRVLPGARSARWGPGAEAGVVLITTASGPGPREGRDGASEGSGARPPGPRFDVGAGSLGRTHADLDWRGAAGPLGWDVGGEAIHVDGAFDFERPPETGGGRRTRENADLDRRSVRGGAGGSLGDGEARVRLAWERLERGLPGRSYAPTPAARQDEERLRVSGAWQRTRDAQRLDTDLWVTRHASRFRDPEPPAGIPYDETTRVWGGGGGATWIRTPATTFWWVVGAGVRLEHQRVRSEGLDRPLVTRTDAGLFATVSVRPWPTHRSLAVDATARVDRAGARGTLHGSHDVTLSGRAGRLALHVAHRSAFNPPSLADQLFREGVGVKPNPDLRGERVPGEVAAGASFHQALGGASVVGGVSVWVGDVRDMIVWTPDFRFVWSPGNVDVRRRGVEGHGQVRLPVREGTVELDGAWSLSRVTHTRPGLEGLQLRYRPRHGGHASVAWRDPRGDVSLEGRYMGARHPTPSRANVLPGFWTLDLAASRDLQAGGWSFRPTVRVERLFDATDAMIFGFPEPGRTVHLHLRIGRSTPPGPALPGSLHDTP